MIAQYLPPRDPRTIGWFSAGDWVTFLLIILSYVCLVKVVLPRYMTGRKEFNLRGIIRLYNLTLVFLNVYFCYNVAIHSYIGGGYSIFCEGLHVKSGDISIVQLHYQYMFVRIVEFLDTVFFVLRKKFNQASLLNISHHCIAVFLPWYGMSYGIDGQICLLSMVNMTVHVIMYSYYFLASFPSLRLYLYWKRYLTLLQIAQFVIIIAHMSIPLFYECGFPFQTALIIILMYIYFFVMFIKFYGSTYQTGISTASRQGSRRAQSPPSEIIFRGSTNKDSCAKGD
ncbi:elongation of very long chain fatty acids protein 2-like [Varroa jacobsoni]|uniref:Elongation of very long chain fatty acids protein n=1 Tax=Varroa destructor TaxID=109461 RepID=A0A7M7KFT6_VARDE|nr:elongation of very long chain fatty acids protein 2-like [Varroa destructor]XP_022666161.1 elongation of very long chain fatty acids protein 2-like [Varroa destructor]XP_022689673.1 elongation of very long chain fatty acids protein 2-like [Varroa jacobsoni]XP_022689674.1 elongation of very long chain fatty acids protein 2-like [Varroa jacobsoni]